MLLKEMLMLQASIGAVGPALLLPALTSWPDLGNHSSVHIHYSCTAHKLYGIEHELMSILFRLLLHTLHKG